MFREISAAARKALAQEKSGAEAPPILRRKPRTVMERNVVVFDCADHYAHRHRPKGGGRGEKRGILPQIYAFYPCGLFVSDAGRLLKFGKRIRYGFDNNVGA